MVSGVSDVGVGCTKPLPVGLPPLEQVASLPSYSASMYYSEPLTKDGGGLGTSKCVCMEWAGQVVYQVVSLNPSNHLQSLPVRADVPGFLSPIAAPCGPCSLEVYLLQAMAGAHASVLGQATQDLGVHDGPYPLPPTPKLHIQLQ